MKQFTYAIIGAGNGGQAMAGYLSMQGHRVRLFDFLPETIDAIQKRDSKIQLTGAVEGIGTLELASNCLKDVVTDADLIFVINPSIYHQKIAVECAKYVDEHQPVFLNPGSTFGAFAFKKALEEAGCRKNIVVAESGTLLFACRALRPGLVHIAGQKARLIVSAFPASQNERIRSLLADAIPGLEIGEHVFVTSMDNTNPLVHPGPTVMNCSWIESGKKFLYYQEGIGPTMGAFIERMDQERIEIGKALGLELGKDLFSMFMQYEEESDVHEKTLCEVFRKVDGYSSIYAGSSVRSRYIYEDVPTGLIPLVQLGEQLHCPVKNLRLVADLCCAVIGEDFWHMNSTRTLTKLGLADMDAEQLVAYAISGNK